MSSSNSIKNHGIIKCKGVVAWGAGEQMVMEEVEVSPPQPIEIRIKVVCISLCRSDVTAWLSQLESLKIVESVGQGVTEFEGGSMCIHCLSENATIADNVPRVEATTAKY